MIWPYRLLFPLALLGAAPAQLRRMAKRGGYRDGFGQRFARGLPVLPEAREGVVRVWVQAVSVGELMAVTPLVKRLAAAGREVVLTTTTSTGMALARERLAGDVAALAYFPLDWAPWSARAWRAFEPDVAVLMEGELWPEHLEQARRRCVPVARINARVSDRTFRRLRRLPGIARWLHGGLSLALAASEVDARRLVDLGVPVERVRVTGNLKFDVPFDAAADACERTDLLDELGLEDAPLILGASTWPGEEQALVDAYVALRKGGVACRLLLVPRHAERREEVAAVLRAAGLSAHFRSRGVAPGPVDVAVADTTGELRRLTQLGDVVFVGKSLPPHREGQTPIEGLAWGRAVVCGPGMGNFRAAVEPLRSSGGIRVVADAAALEPALRELLANPALRGQMGAVARAFHASNRGALDRTVAELLALR